MSDELLHGVIAWETLQGETYMGIRAFICGSEESARKLAANLVVNKRAALAFPFVELPAGVPSNQTGESS